MNEERNGPECHSKIRTLKHFQFAFWIAYQLYRRNAVLSAQLTNTKLRHFGFWNVNTFRNLSILIIDPINRSCVWNESIVFLLPRHELNINWMILNRSKHEWPWLQSSQWTIWIRSMNEKQISFMRIPYVQCSPFTVHWFTIIHILTIFQVPAVHRSCFSSSFCFVLNIERVWLQ